MQALFKMKAIDPDDHRLFSRIVDFSRKLSSRSPDGKGNAAAEGVIADEFPGLTGGGSPADFVRSAAEGIGADASSGLPTRTAVARAVLSAARDAGSDVAAAEAEASSLILDGGLDARRVTVETCREALEFLESLGTTGDGSGYGERMRTLIAAKFPLAKDG